MTLKEGAANRRCKDNVYGEIYGVYTYPKYRNKGMVSELIRRLLELGEKLRLPVIEMEASEYGYSLYQRLGFKDKDSDYRLMKYDLVVR